MKRLGHKLAWPVQVWVGWRMTRQRCLGSARVVVVVVYVAAKVEL